MNNEVNNNITNDFIDDEDNVAVIINPDEDNGILIDNSITNNSAKSINNNIVSQNNDNNKNNESNQDDYSSNIEVDNEITKNKSNDILSSLDKEYASSVGKNVSEVANVAKKNTPQNLVNIDEDNNNLENSDEDNWLVGSNNVVSARSNGDEKATEEEKEKEISKLKSIVNETDDVDPEEVKPNIAKSSFLAMLKPGGQLNKRFAAVVGFGILLVVAVMISRSGNTTTKDAKALPVPDEARTVGKENIETAELSPVRTRYSPKEEETNNTSNPEPVLTVPPPPITIPPPAPAPFPAPKVEVEEKEFAIELRAGTEAALKTVTTAKTEEVKGEEISLQGLSVPMMLLEPFRSGISTLVKAQVVADIRDGKGKVIIPSGSRVQLPFERFEVDGRVINDAQQAALILLPNGNKLSAKGLVKGIDGFAGIRGKVKKLSKGNIFARMGKTVTRVGARVVGVTTGGFAGRGIEDSINESIDQNIEFIPNGRIVEVLPGTRFTFNVN